MAHLPRFLAYAAAFELTFVDDDWRRLEPFFDDDAVYLVTGVSTPCELRGRDHILRGMRKSLDGFDRKMTRREIVATAPPSEHGDRVTFTGLVRYQRADAPAVEMHATLVATFAGDRIVHMHDTFALDATAIAWLGRHGRDLDPSYT